MPFIEPEAYRPRRNPPGSVRSANLRVIIAILVMVVVATVAFVGFTGRADAYHPVVSTNTYCGHETRATSWNYNGSMRTRIDHVRSVTYGTAHVHVYELERAEDHWFYGTTWKVYDVVSRAC